LKILIVSGWLDAYTGGQVVVRDLALGLLRQGQQPLVYSPKPGIVAAEIRRLGIEVVSELNQLTVVPDVIHAQHHRPTVQALLHFPSTPGIYVCHGTTFWADEPFSFPRILRYVAVDDRCRRFVESISGIPHERIEVILNAIDLKRFQPRGPLPSRPKRALVFSNYASSSTHLPAVRSACKQTGLELDVVGLNAGNAVAAPESVLPGYDIVFAKARCALEAMVVGNAVVLCDFPGAGPMVTSANLDSLRRMNFGADVLVSPLKPEHIRKEIERYDPADAAEVSQRIRKEAGLAEAVTRWIALYSNILEEFRSSPRDFDAELRALASYMVRWDYGKRVEWELEQLRRIQAVPVIGSSLRYFARRLFRKWGELDPM
jgi:Glycosyltransferase Family 4